MRELIPEQMRRCGLLLEALAAGDSLGSTTEFVTQSEVPGYYDQCRSRGWPFRQVGGGSFGWLPGEPTDDTQMALCLVRSFRERGHFDGADVAARFIEWMRSGPRDIGGTTATTLGEVEAGVPWFRGGLSTYRANPRAWANGSLMRNGVVAGLSGSLPDAFRITLQQGIITHYAPLPVLCCGLQTWLLWKLLEKEPISEQGIVAGFRKAWDSWVAEEEDPVVQEWHENVPRDLESAWQMLTEADWDPESFNPFECSYRRREGYCLLTLQIAVWAMFWALKDEPFPVPEGFPAEPFERTGGWTLSWVAMVGHDADTYGATAGPLIAAACGGIPRELTAGLLALE